MTTHKRVLAAVRGKRFDRPPIWIMRQAGRYLPEYRDVRRKADGFLDLCYRPQLASEVSLQPLRRFDLDAAIVFSDILVVPHALGRSVRFEEGKGPILEPIDGEGIAALDPTKSLERLAPVLETIERVREGLAPEKTLIGFCGSPWTVATYMIGGQGSADQAAARLFALREPKTFAGLMDVLVDASIAYLSAQLEAGADLLQLFESWALNLDEELFETAVIGPNQRIVEGVRKRHPDATFIGFPRGAAGLLPRYASRVGVNALGLDSAVPVGFAGAALPKALPVQGNLDPLRLVVGGDQMRARVETIIETFSDRPHIFNLGHGIVPQTPIAHVEELVRQVKG